MRIDLLDLPSNLLSLESILMNITTRITLAVFLTTFLVGASNFSFASENISQEMLLIQPSPKVPLTKYWDGTKDVDLDLYKGKYVLVNFWATWCAPCVRELPSLEKLAKKINSDRFLVVAISQDQGAEHSVDPYMNKLGIKGLTVLYDPSRRSFRDFAIRGLPTTVLLSPDGYVIARLEGEIAWDSGAVFKQLKTIIGD
jgi:thiol-disulfide isomerase/thioredoxin